MGNDLKYVERLKVYQSIPGPTRVEMSEAQLRAYIEFLEGRDPAADMLAKSLAVQQAALDGWEDALASGRRLVAATWWVFARGAVFGGGLVGAVWMVLQ